MPAQAICCGECYLPVPAESWNREGMRCRGCGQTVQTAVFPAIERTRTGALPEAIEIETEASCFYHAASRAAVPCSECGRFLCRLCEIEVEGRHICPTCFETGVSSSKLQSIETSRTLYDSIALTFVTFPALLISPMVVGAPAALFIVIRKWRAPGSIVPRTRVRYYIAAILAVIELVAIGFFIYAIIIGARTAAVPKPTVVP